MLSFCVSSSFTAHTDFLQIILGMDDKPLTVYELARDLYTSSCKGPNAITKSLPCRQFICDSLSQTVSDEPGKGIIFDHELAGKGSVKHWLLKYVITNPTFPGPGYELTDADKELCQKAGLKAELDADHVWHVTVDRKVPAKAVRIDYLRVSVF